MRVPSVVFSPQKSRYPQEIWRLVVLIPSSAGVRFLNFGCPFCGEKDTPSCRNCSKSLIREELVCLKSRGLQGKRKFLAESGRRHPPRRRTQDRIGELQDH